MTVSGPATADMLDRLRGGDLELIERMPWSSNATFLGMVTGSGDDLLVIYKPRQGERPLWDFGAGTLALREVAAFEVSEAAGWRIVPPTVLRAEGPFGEGMVQLFVDHDPDEHFLELRDAFAGRFREFAAFDVVANNADRKSGHCIRDEREHIWGIDHGVTFHEHHKLRTVIWDYAGERLPASVADGLCRVQAALEGALGDRLGALLSPREIVAFATRVRGLLDAATFPEPRGDYPYPWPLV